MRWFAAASVSIIVSRVVYEASGRRVRDWLTEASGRTL
jgi:hypothetical protein